jgi:hypothetical protein
VKFARAVEIAFVLMVLLLPAEPLLLANNPGACDLRCRQEAQEPPQAADQSGVKSYPGRITKSNGQYMLQVPASSNAYLLDDQKAAKRYDGKMVLVTGVLDTKSNTIHVKRIEAAA